MSSDFLLYEYSLLCKVVLKIRRNNVCETLQKVILAAVAGIRIVLSRTGEVGWLVGWLFIFVFETGSHLISLACLELTV